MGEREVPGRSVEEGRLIVVPNVSEGRDAAAIGRLADAFSARATLLDTHSDPVHNRTVLTLAPENGNAAATLLSGAEATVETIDLSRHEGEHPRIGALDVCPVVWLDPASREPAREQADAVARGIAALGVPVFLYGELASAPERSERAFFRNGGVAALGARMASGELHADFGPDAPHPTAGATLVTARPPLAAFNLELAGASLEATRRIAAGLRESGGGLPGVRAIGLQIKEGTTQLSTNVHDPVSVALADVVARAETLLPAGARLTAAEVVGLVPRAALAGFPDALPIPGFDPARHVIEERLRDS